MALEFDESFALGKQCISVFRDVIFLVSVKKDHPMGYEAKRGITKVFSTPVYTKNLYFLDLLYNISVATDCPKASATMALL